MRRQLLVLDGEVVDAVVGYRAWEAWVEDGVVHLTSVAMRSVEWPRGLPLRAECFCNAIPRGFAKPGKEPHRCGVYAWKEPVVPRSPRLLDTHAMSGIQPYTLLVGEVLLWGEFVHVHRRGYRAEWAKPSAFYVVDGMSDRLKTVVGLAALQWDVPLVQADRPEGGLMRNELFLDALAVRDYTEPVTSFRQRTTT